jgi:hypothetical protein
VVPSPGHAAHRRLPRRERSAAADGPAPRGLPAHGACSGLCRQAAAAPVARLRDRGVCYVNRSGRGAAPASGSAVPCACVGRAMAPRDCASSTRDRSPPGAPAVRTRLRRSPACATVPRVHSQTTRRCSPAGPALAPFATAPKATPQHSQRAFDRRRPCSGTWRRQRGACDRDGAQQGQTAHATPWASGRGDILPVRWRATAVTVDEPRAPRGAVGATSGVLAASGGGGCAARGRMAVSNTTAQRPPDDGAVHPRARTPLQHGAGGAAVSAPCQAGWQ